ncbi:MAG: beta-galactosidase [Bacteroides sp.]|nr:beta-galactosidase [Bacteroides sp.]
MLQPLRNRLRQKSTIIILAAGLTLAVPAAESAAKSYQIPSITAGVKSHVVDLNGEWQLKFSRDSKWERVKVPGELAMQGFGVKHDTPVTYRRSVKVPADFAGKTIVLRFDGTYSDCTLSINGEKIREHKGGFTRWETDVTKQIRPRKTNTIELTLTDPIDEISYASGYAHHPVAGILRDVTLFALPKDHLTNLTIEALPDKDYRNATAKIAFEYSGKSAGSMAEIKLTAPDGTPLPTSCTAVKEGLNMIELPIEDAQLWDAEHPRLYHLELNITGSDGKLSEKTGRKFGVKEVKTDGNRLLVNGKKVKLRGACRHDMHPTLGRSTNAELDSIDALLFKEANMNFVRTSHYPPSEKFAEMCDKYGIYMECETAVCFVDTYRQKNYAPGASQNDEKHEAQYLSQIEEMASTFSSHPSVLFWSIGNESVYGKNFDKSVKLLRSLDHTRPVIFSYPGTVLTDSTDVYDIMSFHYPGISGNMNQWGKRTTAFNADEGKPSLYDEWAHPACYTYETLQEDPGIREFWGASIEKLWDGVINHQGALGGAIWGYIDERFMLPEPKAGDDYWREFAHTAKPDGYRGKCVGYGDWGIVDIWRRKKPEFAATKRAYSPVRGEWDRVINPYPGAPIRLSVANRFDHTDLSEITARYRYNDKTGELSLTAAAPGQRGQLTIPAEHWQKGEEIEIDFVNREGNVIDSYLLTIGERKIDIPETKQNARPLVTTRHGKTTTIEGDGWTITVDHEKGLISHTATSTGELTGYGPYLHAYINYNHLTGAEVRKTADHLNLDPEMWEAESSTVSDPDSNGNVNVALKGRYGEGIRAEFNIIVTPGGEMNIDYTSEGLPEGYARATGLIFKLPEGYETLTWEREGLLDMYPEDAMSGNQGEVKLTNSSRPLYGEKPQQAWADDTHDYYYWADKGSDVENPLRMSAKSLKENIYHYTLKGNSGRLSVIDPLAKTACRLSRTPSGDRLYIDNTWDYPEIAWGNYCKAVPATPVTGSITLRLSNSTK